MSSSAGSSSTASIAPSSEATEAGGARSGGGPSSGATADAPATPGFAGVGSSGSGSGGARLAGGRSTGAQPPGPEAPHAAASSGAMPSRAPLPGRGPGAAVGPFAGPRGHAAPPMGPVAGRWAAIMAVATLSGFAGLGYEIVWARMLAVHLGHEIVAVLGVVSALFAGLALGALLLGRTIAASARPALWYAGLEGIIGLWALALIALSGVVADLVPALVPVDASPAWQWTVAFALPLVLLAPATLAMGATLPALEAVLAPHLPASGGTGAVGPVYAANTAGAVAGTLATAFLVIPALGLSATLVLCALINFACAGLMVAAGARPAAGAAGGGAVRHRPARHRL